MQNAKIQKLISKAQKLMCSSSDPIHDIGHVARVAKNVKKLSTDLNLNRREQQALELAAWWHDTGRTITRKPSFIWMVLFDDLISAFMLWGHTMRYGLFGSVAGISTRLIFCKSSATGAILTRILLRKKTRKLLDVLKDADGLDLLHIERFKTIKNLSQHSTKNELAFRFLIWVNLNTKIVYMKTEAARKYIKETIIELINWLKQKEIYLWHINHFGKEWVCRTKKSLERLLDEIRLRNIQYNWS